MMIFQVHVGESLQQFLPVVLAHLLRTFVSPFLQLTPFIPPFPISSFLLQPPPLIRPPLIIHPLFGASFIPVLLRQLGLVVALRPRTEIIMEFFFNGLFRRKPPLYGVEHPPRGTPVRRVLVLPGRPVIPAAADHPVVVDEAHGGRREADRRRRPGVRVPLFRVFLVLAVSLQTGSASGV